MWGMPLLDVGSTRRTRPCTMGVKLAVLGDLFHWHMIDGRAHILQTVVPTYHVACLPRANVSKCLTPTTVR